MGEDDIARLFAQEIPEIVAGTIEIKAIARKPGCRTKVALHSRDPRVDCVGACVGVRGIRIKNLVDKLGGERVEMVRWHESPEKMISSALQPTNIEKVVLHPSQNLAVVFVRPDQTSLAYGRRGENRELASQLCGWQIEIEEL